MDELGELPALSSCPFCGATNVGYKIVNGREYKALAVICKVCGAIGPMVERRLINYMRPIPRYGFSKLDHVVWVHGEEAAEAWNRRAT